MRLEIGEYYRGRYKPLRLLGEGALGPIYESEDALTRARVALRVLHPELRKRSAALQWFERDATSSAAAGSKHITDVIDVGSFSDGNRYIVYELLEGMTLDARRQQTGSLPED